LLYTFTKYIHQVHVFVSFFTEMIDSLMVFYRRYESMFETSRFSKSVFSSSRMKNPRAYLAIVIGMFAVLLESAGQITPVSAGAVRPAPKVQTSISYQLAVYMPDTPYCVGQDYQVRVKGIRTFIQERGGTVVDRGEPTPLLAIKIESSVRDEGIATLSPRYQLAMNPEQDDYELGSVYFTLSAKKPGATDLYFETSAFGTYVSSTKSIKVVNCKYRVVVTSAVSGSVPNMAVLIATIAKGEMTAISDNTLSGTADVILNPNAFSPCFTHQVTASPGTANLKGIPSNDGTSLTVTVDFLPIPVTSVSQSTCYTNAGSNNTSNLQHPALEVSVPSSGDSVSKPLSFGWGVLTLDGEAVINVVPIEGQ
jgi:hypothetical protein